MLMISKTYKTTHVRLLPVEIFLQIRHELITEGDVSEADLQAALDSRVCDLEDTIDIEYEV